MLGGPALLRSPQGYMGSPGYTCPQTGHPCMCLVIYGLLTLCSWLCTFDETCLRAPASAEPWAAFDSTLPSCQQPSWYTGTLTLGDSSHCCGPHMPALAPFALGNPAPWLPCPTQAAFLQGSWARGLPQVPIVHHSHTVAAKKKNSCFWFTFLLRSWIHTEMPTALVWRTSQHATWSLMHANGPTEQKPTCCSFSGSGRKVT